jgi:hypothetical protein
VFSEAEEKYTSWIMLTPFEGTMNGKGTVPRFVGSACFT